jgi:hypothetical protein
MMDDIIDVEPSEKKKINTHGYAILVAAQPLGADAELVTIEADLTRGLHSFSIVGLPDKAMQESRDRISAAIRHAGFKSPKATNRRIILSLSPADLRKEGKRVRITICRSLFATSLLPVKSNCLRRRFLPVNSHSTERYAPCVVFCRK